MKKPIAIIRTSRTVASRCTKCEAVMDAATSMNGQAPKELDLSVCSYCGNLMRFNADLTLRTMTEVEFAALPEKNRAQLELLRRIAVEATAKRRNGRN